MEVYNTLTRSKEEFKTLKEGEVNIYICGLTVYDFMHIGHARTYMAFDAILRYLEYKGYKINYVQNVTDVDDKIIKRAKERNLDPKQLTVDFHNKSVEDELALGLMQPSQRPKVTENIGEIIKAVQELIDKGFGYVTEDGVYFDLSKDDDYGKLSHQNEEQLESHRIEPNPNKKTPLDFALWKSVPAEEYGFDSPWGYGRPGWHIECSVMSRKYLGDQLDMHGGALDLIFPHHENEIAQSEALTGKQFVQFWLHTGFLQSSGEKMSKSLGNILPVRDFLKEFSPEAFRLFILQTHYRSPIDYSRKNVEDSAKAFQRFKEFRNRLAFGSKGKENKAFVLAEDMKNAFIEAMDDDFNSSKAVSEIFEHVRDINGVIDAGTDSSDSLNDALKIFDEIMGVLGFTFEEEVKIDEEVLKLVREREEARKNKDWAKSDEIRDTLAAKGYTLNDNNDGTTRVEKV